MLEGIGSWCSGNLAVCQLELVLLSLKMPKKAVRNAEQQRVTVVVLAQRQTHNSFDR